MDAQAILELCAQKPNEFLYLLIDALQSIDQNSPLHVSQLSQHGAITVPRADLEHSPHFCPQLVILAMPESEPNLDLLNAALEMVLEESGNTKRIVCGCLTSEEGPTDVAYQLAAHCIVREHPENPRRLIPLFEPHRLTLLHLTANETWLNGWLGSIATWIYFDQLAMPQQLSRRQLAAWNECLSPEAARTQNNASAIASLLLAWQRTGRFLPANAAQCVLDQISEAQSLGLITLEDQLVFGLSRLTVHPRLERHPAVQAAIENAKHGRMPLARGFEAIPDAAWRGMTPLPTH